MDPSTLLVNLGSIAFFQSRAFLTAWLSAMLIRFGPQIPLLRQLDYIAQFQGSSSWLSHDFTLLALGALAALEFAATKNDEAREILDELDQYVKPVIAMLITLGALNAADAAVLGPLQQAGISTNLLLSALIGAATFRLAMLRHYVLMAFHQLDEDDSLGLQGLLGWLEDLWVMLGLLLLLVYPIMVLALTGLLWLGMLGLHRYFEHREQNMRTSCVHCGTLFYPSAMVCPGCHAQVEQPRRVGLFGTALAAPVTDRHQHQMRLIESKRCPDCATRLQQRSPRQQCQLCGYELFADPGQRQAYDQHIRQRLPQAMLVCTLLGLVPLLGIIVGIVYYRLRLVAPFSRYLPRLQRFGTKLLLRLVTLVLIVLQLVPFAGAATVPLLALLNYTFYRRAFQRQLVKQPHGLPL